MFRLILLPLDLIVLTSRRIDDAIPASSSPTIYYRIALLAQQRCCWCRSRPGSSARVP